MPPIINILEEQLAYSNIFSLGKNLQSGRIHSHRPACREQGEENCRKGDGGKANRPIEYSGHQIEDSQDGPAKKAQPAVRAVRSQGVGGTAHGCRN